MHTPELDGRMPKIGRRLAATASLAAATIVGATVGAGPANATETAFSTETATAAPITPVATLVPNHSSVTVGHPVTFTVTERTSTGTAVSSAQAAFYVYTIYGWEKVATKTLSTAGSATFSYTPGVTHGYQVDLSAVTRNGVKIYNAVDTPTVIVKATPADIGPQIVAAAAKENGKPYRYGAAGPNAFDCSGLVKYVFAKFGINLPHQANAQKNYGTRVSRLAAKPGDLVFVMSGSYAYHVGIYAGNGTWWEAPHSGAYVRHVNIWSSNVQFRHVR